LAVFYQVSPALLPAYIDLGLRPFKLGEEAHVDLASFSLVGGKLRNLRQSHAKALRDGLSFEVVLPEMVGQFIPELKLISDAWLEEKQGREKGFLSAHSMKPICCRGPWRWCAARASWPVLPTSGPVIAVKSSLWI